VTKDQREVCSLSRGVMSPKGSTPVRPITGRRWLPPSSSTRRPMSRPRGRPSLAGGRRAYHVPPMCQSGKGRSSSPVVSASALGEFGAPSPDHVPFWPKRISTFRLSSVTTINAASRMLAYPLDPGSRPPWCWRSWLRLAPGPSPKGGFVVLRASHLLVAKDACPSRIPPAERRVPSALPSHLGTVTSATSCRTRTTKLTCRGRARRTVVGESLHAAPVWCSPWFGLFGGSPCNSEIGPGNGDTHLRPDKPGCRAENTRHHQKCQRPAEADR